MTRKLLPYEHELVAALGITKDEYLEFLALQKAYEDPKEGTELDIKNGPGVVALVLTIVGTLFQVAAALLAPKPEIPGIPGGRGAQTREQRTSPRFGFNSTQELARYGDPIPLVYTNIDHNSAGAVRIATRLLWSGVKSLGTKQFIRLQMLLSAGPLVQVNANKSAFGQVPIRDLTGTNTWIYFNSNGTQAVTFNNAIKGTASSDPTYTNTSGTPYAVETSLTSNSKSSGFSHAYTPTSANKFGIYSPVPINVFVYARVDSGARTRAPLGIAISDLTGYAGNGFLQQIPVNETFRLSITKTNLTSGTPSQLAAQNARRGYATVFDEASLFKLGSAIFRVTNVSGIYSDDSNINVDFQRVGTDPAYSPSTPYSARAIDDVSSVYQQSNILIANPVYIRLERYVNALLEKDDRNVPYADLEPALQDNAYTQVLTAQDLLQVRNIWTIKYAKVGANDVNYAQVTGWTKKNLTTNQIRQIQRYISLTNSITLDSNDLYYTKALVRYEVATYQTLQACHAVDLGIKTVVYKQISGRQSTYGSQNYSGYRTTDNGYKNRAAMFILRYREANPNTSTVTWNHVPGIFVVRRNNESENYLNIRFNSNQNTAKNWHFELEPISDPRAEALTRNLRVNGKIQYLYMENISTAATITMGDGTNVQFYGYSQLSNTDYPINSGSPRGTNQWDLFSLDADTNYNLSLDRGPEFTLLCVTEHILAATTTQLYSNMSLIGFNAYSSKGLQDLRSFTAFVEKGRPVFNLFTTNTAPYYNTTKSPSSYAPDIFLDTILDQTDGIGKYAPPAAVDLPSLTEAKKFCVANNLYFDGVIADPGSWREFWATVAPYSLLEFGRKNGKETLVPAVPFDAAGNITTALNVSALYNQGNIIEDSYKEEFIDFGSGVQDLITTIIYRSIDSDGIFARNKSVGIKRSDVNEADAVRQTFDISAYVSTRAQALKYGKLLCNIRRYVRTSIEFRTYPTTSFMAPGAFIYVDIGQNSWDNIRTGLIGPGGKLNIPAGISIPDGSYQFLFYKSGAGVQAGTHTVTGGVASGLSNKDGYIFVVGNQVKARRVFRVTEVDMNEEGEVTIRATGYPCTQAGTSLIADFSDGLFTVTD